MAYNPYAPNPYGPPPTYGAYPGAGSVPPGMAPPPGLGPPPGMSSAPGMAPPPGVQPPSHVQANRQSGLPPNFQTPNIPNFDFSAPVIRLSALGGKPSTPVDSGRRDSATPTSGRPGLGSERGPDQSRAAAAREALQSLVPPTHEERLRTIFIHKIPAGVGGDKGMEKLLNALGPLRRWDTAASTLSDAQGAKFGFAQFEDVESFAIAVEILEDTEVPAKQQSPKKESDEGDAASDVDMVKLQVTIDPASRKYLESYKENRGEDSAAESRLQAAREAFKQIVQELAHPKAAAPATDTDGDAAMANSGEDVEVVNIALAQDDELADIPAEMREVVAAEIAAFRERSIQRDMERLKREEELEERERRANGAPRRSRLDSPGPDNANNVPVGPRGAGNVPSGPRGGANGNRSVSFVNGGVASAEYSIDREDEESEADDDELYQRRVEKEKAEEDKMYIEAERKWFNRERSRQAALERERERELREEESIERRRQEQLEREKAWDDEREASRKTHLYYRDHAAWVRKRQMERAEEAARDEHDRRTEVEERRREETEMERAQGMADSFLDRQAEEMEKRQQAAAAAAPAPFKLSLGAAAQRAQAQRVAPSRRTIAEVEGLLDDEEQESTTKRQLIPIQFEPTTAADKMTEEELNNAIRALAQEIPSEKEGLWKWDVQWDHLDDTIIREKLRPFVEKKIVEYLGVQEELLVEVVEEHLRKHGKPEDLVEELTGALDDEAEDMAKKLWRMVIFFTECEKRGYPA
ncbi:hypothetical protein ACRALDRAFT_1073857 [Sodiomyces alcalophilus JCM 7366]|uniref:uncharacterized protein n=1 Tax=Sodiomyces alcalophilus JCM 7366 TaxID=591952 RepID=UPI0039B482E4